MSLREKKILEGKVRRRLRRSLAFIMAVILMLSPMPGVSFTAHGEGKPAVGATGGAAPGSASTDGTVSTTPADRIIENAAGGETPSGSSQVNDAKDEPAARNQTPDPLKENEGGYTTAWKVGGGNGKTGFDIEGIEDFRLMHPNDPAAPYTGNRDQGIETTHLHSGFQTYVQTYDPSNPQAVNQSEELVPLTSNGAVYDFPSKGIQVQMKLHLTWDKKFIQVDYVVHNTKDTANQVQIGTSADIQLGKRGADAPSNLGDPSDSSLLNVNSRGIHMTNGTKASFECMFNYHDLDLTKPDSIWVGDKAAMDANRYNSQDSTQGGDAAMSYSWTIDLAPGGTVTKSVAYGAKGASYYVSMSGNDNNDGSYARPFRTIQKAVDRAGSGPITYIYLQGDYTYNAGITTSGKNVDISSADYDKEGNPSDSIYVYKSSTGRNSMFYGNYLGTLACLRFGNIVLDGSLMDSISPTSVVNTLYGAQVALTSGTTIQNARKNNAWIGGSAVTFDDNPDSRSSVVNLNNCTITNNRSDGNCVYVVNKVIIEGKCIITDNTDPSGRQNNLYLYDQNSDMVAADSLAGSKIGIKKPVKVGINPSPPGNATNSNQEFIIVKPVPGSVVDQAPPPFADVFIADQPEQGYYTTVGSPNLGTHNDRNVVLRRNSPGISFTVGVKDGDKPIPNPPVIPSVSVNYGQSVSTAAAPVIPGYRLYETKIDQGASATLQAAAPGTANAGQITGTMPNQNVAVTYLYEEAKTQITFDTNGGMTNDGQTELPVMIGGAGTPLPPMPQVAREGYLFKGWSESNTGPDSPIFSWDVFPNAPDGLKLYAVFAPDPDQTYSLTTEYSNADDTVIFKPAAEIGSFSVETSVNAEAVPVPGYTWEKNLSNTDPADIGQFADVTGAYMGKMPAAPLTVHYGYRVNPNTTFPLTIRYESVNGAQLAAPLASGSHPAEETVTADPTSIDHYTCTDFRFDDGTTDGQTEAGYVKPVTAQPDPTHGFHWSAPMPNQPVTLTYLYAGDGAENSKFTIAEHYEDAGSHDPALKDIMPPKERKQIPTDTPVDGTYTSPYGYQPVRPFAAPVTTAPSGTNITFGTGDNQDKWSGAMPAGDVTITYQNNRDPLKWADLTYKAGPHGALTLAEIPDASPDPIPPASPDVQDNGDGSYKAGILINDASADGQAKAYDFAAIKKKKLLPNPQAADPDHYRFKEWLLDADKSGTLTPEDTPCTDSQTFTGPATLIASFEEIPEQWTDLHFKAEKGSLDSTGKPESLHIEADKTWQDITDDLPTYTPWNSYTAEGSFWYREGDAAKTPMEPGTPLQKGAVYIHQFVPSTDPQHTYTLTKIYKSTSGTVLKTDPEPGKHIDDPVTAAPLSPEETPGFTLKPNGWSVSPASYQFIPGTDQQLNDYFDASGNYSGPMPGEDLTVTYLYEPTEDTYTLKVQYLSANGVPLATVPDQSLQADEPFTARVKHMDGYTCDRVTIDQITDQPGLTQVEGTPTTESDFTSRMPNQDITITYRYIGSQTEADRHTLTVTYIDTGSRDPLLKELPGGSAVTYYPDQPIAAGTFQPPAGYRKDSNPEKAFTIDPPDRGIRFTDESQSGWTGFMPYENVTITCYCERIPGDQAHPENNYWGDLTFQAGADGGLKLDGTVSPDVTGPDGGPYTAEILLEKAGSDAYTWKTIKDKHLLPIPEAEPYYEFAGWYIDKDASGTVNEGDTPLGKGGNTDPAQADSQTFAGPATLIASFTKASGDWMTLNFAVAQETEPGKEGWNGGSLTNPDQRIELPSGTKTWGDIRDEVNYTQWPGYVLAQVTDSNGAVIEDGTQLKVPDTHTGPDPYTDTFTLHFKPSSDPQDAHTYQVQYIGRDSSGQEVVFGPREETQGEETQGEAQKKFVTDPVEADRKNVQGYDWVKETSGTNPARYEFIPGHPEEIGSFDPDTGHFTGHMPLSDLTLTYRYKLRQDAAFPLNVSYQLKTEAGEPGPQIHEARPTEEFTPGAEVTIGPEPDGGPIDGFLYDGYQLVKGDAHETEGQTEDHQLLNPVTGRPDDDGQWSFTMPNQEVSLIYLYKVDPTKTNKLTEAYVETDPTTGQETDIINPVTHHYAAGTGIDGNYPKLYGYNRVTPAMPVITGAEDWTGDDPIEVASDGLTWQGTMIPKDLTVTYRYERIQTLDPDHPDADHPWGSLIYLPGKHGTVIRDGNVSQAVTDYSYTVPNTDPTQTIQGYKASVLLDEAQEGTLNQPYTFGDIKNKQLIPTAKANQYYQWEGWFIDANHNGLREAGEPLLTDAARFPADSSQEARTLTASFAEITDQWTDIHLKTEHAAFTDESQEEDHKLRVPKGIKWQDVMPHLPTVTPEVNYVYGGWYEDKDDAAAGRPPMDGQTIIQNDHTYTYVASRDPQIFGTGVETPEAQASLDGQGKGRVTVYETKEGEYQYILTDPDGIIQKTAPKRSQSETVEFDGLQPGYDYQVYEARPQINAEPGTNLHSLGLTEGTDISPARTVRTPVLTDNYEIYYSDPSGEDTKTTLLIRPADPASDYAVLNPDGTPVPIPGAQEGGFITPSGLNSSGSTSSGSNSSGSAAVQVPGLTYGENYTVVARIKGQTGVSPIDRIDYGSVITAAPAGQPDLKSYIIATTLGEITEIEDPIAGELEAGSPEGYNSGSANPGSGNPGTWDSEEGGPYTEGAPTANSYAAVHKGASITLLAPADYDGEEFDHWEVTVGTLKGQELPEGNEITFTMPDCSLVMTPVYKHNAYPYANVTDEVRGGNKNEIALDPNEIPGMERTLTDHEKDNDLITVNGADVTYKLVYKKGKLKQGETEAIKGSGEYETDHEAAYHAAWALDVFLERYVDGRKVPIATSSDAAANTEAVANAANDANAASADSTNAAAATPSDAAGEIVQFDGSAPSYLTYIQMGRDDLDMLDYQLYKINPDGTAQLVPLLSVSGDVDPNGDIPEQSGGLFAFRAEVGSRYVMVYNRAYHLYFSNHLPPLGANDEYGFKVRQNEYQEYRGYYDEQKENIPQIPASQIAKSGAEYKYLGWSYSPDNADKKYDKTRPIKNTTHVYAVYSDNEAEVARERQLLDQAIREAEKLSRDPFLKRQDSEALKQDIKEALEVLNQEDPHRSVEEALREARENLERQLKHYQEQLKAAQDQYDEIQNHNSGGGSSGGGGSGSGSKADPYNATPNRNYTVGTNGSWVKVNENTGQQNQAAQGDQAAQPTQWAFVLNGGMRLRSTWAYLSYPEAGNATAGWYHFNANAIMDTGWYTDEAGKWYYSYKQGEGPEGRMTTGWRQDAADTNWYYLDPSSGAMTTGWRQIDGKWYYFEPIGMNTYDAATGQWTYGGAGGAAHPMGAMYKNETTPDGYPVDANGAWIQ